MEILGIGRLEPVTENIFKFVFYPEEDYISVRHIHGEVFRATGPTQYKHEILLIHEIAFEEPCGEFGDYIAIVLEQEDIDGIKFYID